MHKLKRKLGRYYQITRSFGTMVGGLNLWSKVEVTTMFKFLVKYVFKKFHSICKHTLWKRNIRR